MGRYQRLISNTIIFAIGNIGTKFITFFLVPFYTFYLTTINFGKLDLLTNTVALLLPIFSFSIYDAVLRFVMEKKVSNSEILSSSLLVLIVGMTISILCFPLIKYIGILKNLYIYLYLLIFLQGINSIFLQYVRAINKIKLYTISSMLTSIVTLLLAIIFLKNLSLGMQGYLFTQIGSYLFSIILLFFSGRIYNSIDLNKINKHTIFLMLSFSIPLIPNALMWWIMQVSDRYLVSFFLGVGANGLYAVANKIPSLLSMVYSIFFQAWQMSAIEESNSKDKSLFFNNVFSAFCTVMLISASGILLLLKLIVKYSVSVEYQSVWEYVPFLLIAVVFSSFSGFLGTNYIAMKETVGVIKTSLFGAVLNIILNLIFIPKWGINGASFATMMSFFLIWVLRMIDTRKFVNIKINYFQFISSLFVLFLQIYILFTIIKYQNLIQILLFLILIVIQLPSIINIKNQLIKR